MDRNLILAIVLSVLIVLVFQHFFQAYSPPKQPGKQPAEIAEQKPLPYQETGQPPAAQEQGSQAKTPEAVYDPSDAEPFVGSQQFAAKDIVIDTPKYEAVLASKGGRLVSFKLKDFRTKLGGDELVNLFNPGGTDTAGPSIMLTYRDHRYIDYPVNYETNAPAKIRLDEGGQRQSVTFQVPTTTGLAIAKTYTFHADSYQVDLTFSLTNNSGENRNYLVTFPWRKDFKVDGADRFAWDSAEIFLNKELKDVFFSAIKGDEEFSGQVQWAGLGEAYFFKALVFGDRPAAKVTLFKPVNNVAEIKVRYGAIDVPAGQTTSTQLALYLGPKERGALEAAGHNLSHALVYSYYKVLDVMSEYLIRFLKVMNSGFTVGGIKIPGTGNWGWDIILLTIIIKILFIPLTHKSMKSMKRMQDLQPQLQKLKEKFKDDKAGLNKATMELFRDQKVNPLGSCWPMFLQMPVFIALYQALSYAIELRHAQFVCIPSIYLCINDLSAPDPYYVTPVLMGGTMLLQQWLTPSAGDPTQKKMMMIMPVVFTWLFLNFPSGLVLYWLVNNVLSIGQQVITNRMAE